MPIQGRRRWPSILAIVASFLIPAFAAGADDVRVRSTVANIRAEGSAQGKVLFQVKAGDVLRVIGVAGDWLQVETADGRRGFVSKSVTEAVSAAAPARSSAPAAPAGRSTAGTLAIDHKEVGCIVGDRYPRLDACFQPAGQLGNAKVLFRAGDSNPWYAVDLMPEGACHIAYLPKPLAKTTEIQYYVAAVDKSFNERQQPETAPETAYRARVVKNQGDCDSLKKMAASVAKVARPIVVAAGRTGMGAPAVLGALLVGFSQEGVILASAAVAAGAGGAAAAGASAGAAGSGGGIGTGTLAVAGGVVAAGALVAAVAGGGGGGGDEPACTAFDLAGQNPGVLVVVDAQTICSPLGQCGRGLTLRACVGGVCTNNCSAFYELSDGRRFSCGSLPNCFSGTGNQFSDPNFCVSAAQQATQACGP
jgi:SH3 domain-containing protein